MVGIKGKSGGKATTPEAKALKSQAARVREERRAKTVAIKGQLGDPVTYGDLLKSVQVDGELLQNERRAIEVQRAEVELAKAQDEHDKERGNLLTKEQHRAAVQSVVELILASVPILTDAALSQHPPEQHPTVRHALTKAEAAFRLAAMAAIKQG